MVEVFFFKWFLLTLQTMKLDELAAWEPRSTVAVTRWADITTGRSLWDELLEEAEKYFGTTGTRWA